MTCALTAVVSCYVKQKGGRGAVKKKIMIVYLNLNMQLTPIVVVAESSLHVSPEKVTALGK